MIEKHLAPINYAPDRNPTCVILGSFRNKTLIDRTIDQFTKSNIDVLAPPKGNVKELQAGFKILEGDDLSTHHWIELEDMFMRNMTRADVLWLANPDGYIGSSTSWELGVALGHGIPVYGMSRVTQVADDDPRDVLRTVYGAVDPMPVESFIKMVNSRVLDITRQVGFIPQNERREPSGFITLPMVKGRMPDSMWRGILEENEVPQRLVHPQDWPFD